MSKSDIFTYDLILSIIYITTCVILSITSVFLLYFWVVSKWKEEQNTIKISIITFFLCSISSILLLVPVVCWRSLEIPYGIHEIAENIFIIFYALQSYLVVVIFFHKLNNVFNNTLFQLSDCIKNIYYFTFIIFPLIVVVMFILFVDNHSVIEYVTGFGLILLMCPLGCLFVSKLITVYRINQENGGHSGDNVEINAITKITILICMSIFSTFIHVIAAMTVHGIEPIYNYCELLDVYCNFICIMLCYKCFHSGYIKLCWCIDSFCHIYCTKLADCSSGKNVLKLGNYIVKHKSQKPKIEVNQVSEVPASNGNENV